MTISTLREVYRMIPVYPKEISKSELAKKLGVSNDKLHNRLANSGRYNLLCEDDGKYCFLTKEGKRRAMKEDDES
jgi:Mn-dependent DtxR family transcriptional regulator